MFVVRLCKEDWEHFCELTDTKVDVIHRNVAVAETKERAEAFIAEHADEIEKERRAWFVIDEVDLI